jgi:hypothetical protein
VDEKRLEKPSESTAILGVNIKAPNGYYVLLAQLLKVSVVTLYRWVKAGKVIQPTYFGCSARWTGEQIKQILKEGTKPAGTYPPASSPRSAMLLNRPKTATQSVGSRLKPSKPSNSHTRKTKSAKPAVKDRRSSRSRKRGE